MVKFLGKVGAGLIGALCLGSGAASATTLDDVTLGSLLFSSDGLDVISDDTFLEAFGVIDPFDVFVSMPLDGGKVDEDEAGVTDLVIVDIDDFFTEILGGTALDIEVDAAADTISILYDLAINEESSDPFGVAVLYFDIGLLTDAILDSAGDLDGETVDLDIFGATSNTPPIIPLPAGAVLLLSGLVGFGWVRRKRNA